ncbi:MAG: hypothetical protein D6E12_00735 [Desulfovibrio sp.]|nr:MAG: hypothetical protein D6E12_00735 [Desulfovibrio sp.]
MKYAMLFSVGGIAVVLLVVVHFAWAEDFEGWNLQGGDYDMFQTSSVNGARDECVQACQDYGGCIGATVVYSGAGFPMCYLKTGAFTAVEDPSAYSWGKPLYYSAEPNTDRPGQDYASFELASPQFDHMECRRRCQEDSRCMSFSYVLPGTQAANGLCWLKDGLPMHQPAQGVMSGLIYERVITNPPSVISGGYTTPASGGGAQGNAVQNSESMAGVDLPGHDYHDFDMTEANPAMCLRVCQLDAQCRAYTYMPPGVLSAGPHCWLKNGVPAQQPYPEAVSGIVAH